MDESTIGARIRSCRRYRGMTLDQLAGLTGLSKGHLSRVENGLRTIDRRSHLDAVAEALQVSASDLTGDPTPRRDAALGAAQATIPRLRVALMDTALEDTGTGRSRPLVVLADEMRSMQARRSRCEWDEVGKALPGLLLDLHAAAAHGDAAGDALRHLVWCCRIATDMAKDMGHVDLAWTAAERGRQAAELLDDPVWLGVADFTRTHALMAARARRQALKCATTAADLLEPHLGDERAAEVYGMLRLSSALGHAVAERVGDADDHLTEAARHAARLGDRPDTPGLHTGFGPTNVGIWRVSISLELGHADDAVGLARNVDPSRVGMRSREAAYHADVGLAYARLPRHQKDAVKAFREAERLAPQRLHANVKVRDAVAVMLNRAVAAAGGRDLRGLANRLGVAA